VARKTAGKAWHGYAGWSYSCIQLQEEGRESKKLVTLKIIVVDGHGGTRIPAYAGSICRVFFAQHKKQQSRLRQANSTIFCCR
jgi:hypothetical protein